MQIGKKKLVLDHLIVQKMDDDENATENVQSILTYGAQALFDSAQNTKDIVYTDNDLENLIIKTEQEPEVNPEETEKANLFAFAKIWTADKETGEELGDEDQADAWTQALQTITAEREKLTIQEIEKSGRGAGRRAKVSSQLHGRTLDLTTSRRARSITTSIGLTVRRNKQSLRANKKLLPLLLTQNRRMLVNLMSRHSRMTIPLLRLECQRTTGH
jgi:hypothetical protein